jgi:dCTP deaminase
MILSDREIQAAIRDKNILIDPPPDEALFSSTALDLTLDGVLLRWKEPGNHPAGRSSFAPLVRASTSGR